MAYTIQKGDTLSAIARQNNTTVAELLKLNPYITDANKISAGKSLNLPGQTATAPATPTTPSYGNAYDYALAQLEQSNAASRQAQEAAAQAQLAELEAGKETVAQQAYDNTRAVNANYAQTQRLLPEQMARLGLYATGASETSQVSTNNAYRSALGDVNLNKTQALQNIDTQKRNVQANSQSVIQSAYSDYLAQRANIILQAEDNKATQAAAAQSARAAANNSSYSQALQKAETMAKYGDFSGYKALGYTQEEVASMKAAYDGNVADNPSAEANNWLNDFTAKANNALKSMTNEEYINWLQTQYEQNLTPAQREWFEKYYLTY